MLEAGWIGALGLEANIRCLRPRGGEGVLEEQAFELAPGKSAESEDFLSKHNAQRTDGTVGTWAVPSPEAGVVFPVHGQGTHFSHPHHSRAAAADGSCSLLRPAGNLSSAYFPEASACSCFLLGSLR